MPRKNHSGQIYPVCSENACSSAVHYFRAFRPGFLYQIHRLQSGSPVPRGVLHWGQPNLFWASLTMALLTLPAHRNCISGRIHSYRSHGSSEKPAWHWEPRNGKPFRKLCCRVPSPASLQAQFAIAGGEVAPIPFTGAAYYLAELPHSPTSQFMSLGYHIYIMSTQSTNVDETLPIQFATTLVLLLLTFSLSMIAVTLHQKNR